MTHIDLLNAVLALRFTQPGWDTVFEEHEYLVHGIGVAFMLEDKTVVSPDVLLNSAKRSVSLLVEVKGGASFDHEQLGRMLRVTPRDLHDSAYLLINDVTDHSIGIVYVCDQQQFDAFVDVTQDRNVTIVGFDGETFTFGGTDLPDGALQASWSALHVPSGAPPLNIIPFDQDSDLGTIARAVLPELVAALVRGDGYVTADAIFQRTHDLCWQPMQSIGAGADASRIKKRITELLHDAAQKELSSWIAKTEGKPMWRFTNTLPPEPSQRTRALKSLQGAAKDLIERLPGGRPGAQLELFTDLV